MFKNLVLQALQTIRIRFLQKKYFKKFHACVPLMKRFLYAVRPTLDILGDTIAILLDRELERPWDQIFAENKGEWKKKVINRIN